MNKVDVLELEDYGCYMLPVISTNIHRNIEKNVFVTGNQHIV